MKIFIGCDHAGLDLKNTLIEHLKNTGHTIEDCGTNSSESVHYPDIAASVVKKVKNNKDSKGIVICGTGIGISIAANKFNGIRAALCSSEFDSRHAVLHNNANILALGARTVGSGLACSIADAFFSADFEGGRHQIRLDIISDIEKGEGK